MHLFIRKYFIEISRSEHKLKNKIEENTLEVFNKYRKRCEIYIDNNWIHTVAKLSQAFDKDTLKDIYELYGDINTIKRIFNDHSSTISINDANISFSLINKYINPVITLTHALPVTADIKEKTKIIINKIENIAEL